MSDKNFATDPNTGPLEDSASGKAPNQLDLAKNPSRFTFEIVCDPLLTPAVRSLFPARKFEGLSSGTVERVDLKINPSQYRVSEPTRQNVTQTIAGAWVDYYGLGLPKITMSGTTGWRPPAAAGSGAKKGVFGDVLPAIKDVGASFSSLIHGTSPNQGPQPSGLKDFISLRNQIFRTYALLIQKLPIDFKDRVQSPIQLRFYAWDTQDYYIVLIDNFELVRNASRPMLYDYNISMTVIGYVDSKTTTKDYLKQYWSPNGRTASILEGLQRFLTNAQNFENSVNVFSQSISSSIGFFTNQITAISTALTSLVNGASTLMSLPQTVIQDAMVSARELAGLITTFENIPTRLQADMNNDVVSAYCALSALNTYTVLFTQPFGNAFATAPWANLSCSSTLGIPPDPTQPDFGIAAPVKGSSSATTGVYDPNMTQGAPVSVGSATLATTKYRIKEVVISEGQTPETLIQSIGGLDSNVAQVWQQIVTLNNLEYPYIAPSASFQSQFYSIVTANFYGTPGTVIPSGTSISTLQSASPGDQIIFSTLASTIIGLNGVASVQARAGGAGDYANIKPLAITHIVDVSGNPIVLPGVTGIENPTAGSGGKIVRVLRPGQKIQIPVPQSTAAVETVVDRTNVVEQNLFGNDVFLDTSGDLQSDFSGDLAIVRGLENMQTALIDRLTTNQGELIKHPTYGAPIQRIVGQPGDRNALAIARLELIGTLLSDPRILNVSNLALRKSNDVLNVSMNLSLIDETSRHTNAQLPI